MSEHGGPDLPQRRLLVTDVPGPNSIQLNERRRAAVSSALGAAVPVFVDRAGGGVVIDVDGNSLIDLGSGIAVTSVGNSAPHVVAGIRDQSERLIHTCFMVAGYEAYLEVCEQLNDLTPGDHDKRTALFNSGAEAVENAVKVARSATGRAAVVAVEHAYHGRTSLAMALTAKNRPYKHSFGPLPGDIHRVPNSYPLRDGLTGAEAAARSIRRMEAEIGGENIAAIVIEPIQGEGGFIVPASGFLPELSRWARDNGIVFIADEVQTGFCRTGEWFASEHDGVVPDLVAMAKGLAGGMPLSAVTGRADLMNAAHLGGLGGTYGGNPVACAAALGAIATMKELDLNARARHLENLMRSRLGVLADECDIVAEVRGRGAMIAIEFAEPGTLEPVEGLVPRVAKRCAQAGVIVLTAGTYGNVIRLLPPLVIDDELLIEGLDVLSESVKEEVGR
ncbi:MAG: 4-aminobutyrate--2-oxoglutarate transaminase [Candidatus Nanopelagicales bacterium]|nr:4-aminobutyrate--2-oxoglutarate transaminase [Candidatus Nanopelagicales bacterium]